MSNYNSDSCLNKGKSVFEYNSKNIDFAYKYHNFLKFKVYLTCYLSIGQIIQFDNVISNVGSGYNEDKGVFTAPSSGYYQFHVHAHTVVHKQAEVRVMVQVT